MVIFQCITMAFNLSNVDLKLLFDANTAATISMFTLLVLPPFLLCLLCMLALVFAKEINLKIRLLLINIFTAEVLNWFSFFILYLGWSARFINEEDTSCQLFISFYAIAGLLKFSATSLYAVSVYVFIKYGDKKLKWYVIIPYIVVVWIAVTLTVGVPPYLEEYGAQNTIGFCTANVFSAPYIGMAVSLTVGAMFFLSIELIFCILTVVYMKRNVLEGNTSVKKAVAKILGYMAVVSVLSFINSIPPYFIGMIIHANLVLPGRDFVAFLAGVYMTHAFTNITAFPTPIVTIILLKPVRDAIKAISKKVCPCCHKNREFSATIEEHPTTTTTTATTTTTEEHPTTGIIGASLPTTTITGNHMASIDQNLATTDQNLTTTGIDLDTIQASTTDQNPVENEATIEKTFQAH